jgi:hypothetical protein
MDSLYKLPIKEGDFYLPLFFVLPPPIVIYYNNEERIEKDLEISAGVIRTNDDPDKG